MTEIGAGGPAPAESSADRRGGVLPGRHGSFALRPLSETETEAFLRAHLEVNV